MPYTFQERIGIVIGRAGGPKLCFEKTGIARRTLSSYETGPSEPNRTRLVALARAGNVTIEWLMTGEEPMQFDEVGVGGFAEPRARYSDADSMAGEYTLVAKREVQAGAGAGVVVSSEHIVDHLAFRTEWLRSMGLQPKDLVLISAFGDSMEPTIFDGGLLAVKRVQMGLHGSLTMKSDNPNYEPRRFAADQMAELRVIGRVVWRGGRRF